MSAPERWFTTDAFAECTFNNNATNASLLAEEDREGV